MPGADRSVSPTLLEATADTLRRYGPRQFSLTAVAETAGVSRGTVHNALGSRDNAIKVALDHLASAFIETMAAALDREESLTDQVAAAAALICAHRQQSDSVITVGFNESILVLLLRNTGDDLMRRSVELWKPRIRAAQQRGEVAAGVAPARAAEWIVRLLLSFELLPPIGVNLDSARAVRRFVSDHIVVGLTGGQP
ncbi:MULTISPECIES: TetR/AcrR family transcriptional regulator [unclassified Mycolicibacterium]|uniref:TetR/AcrR family transcriptional regulator n=1 Tax=unclassified Mycolicibacterium TaxID=2636767 RepID=UPI002EDA2047